MYHKSLQVNLLSFDIKKILGGAAPAQPAEYAELVRSRAHIVS